MTSSKDLFHKLKKPFKSSKHNTLNDESEKPSEPPAIKESQDSKESIITQTSKGKLQTFPPKTQKEPLPPDLHGDYTNYKLPTHETVINQPPGLNENYNPYYTDNAKITNGTGNFYYPKNTTTEGTKEQATQAVMETEKQRKLRETREALSKGNTAKVEPDSTSKPINEGTSGSLSPTSDKHVLNPNLTEICDENVSTTAVYNQPISTPKSTDTDINSNKDKKTTTESYATGGAFGGLSGVIAATAATAVDYIGFKSSNSDEKSDLKENVDSNKEDTSESQPNTTSEKLQ
ncbi:hypothetical protein DFJ63DRAFT_250234 [Scheffersomyces coipomensis]|uniref:uncharacterized protein n=1 Tax=Scheffersomyces coipomensis TaxID=1788519 RepID=UPI00315CDEBB